MKVTWWQTFPLPQQDDMNYGLPFCRVDGLSPAWIPEVVQLLRMNGDGETLVEADSRDYTHFNLLRKDEMDDLPAALNERVQELGETHDLIIVGEGERLETSQYIGVFMAPKSLH